MNQLTPTNGSIAESVIAKGDLAKLTTEQRTQYYVEVCKSLGLNPLTKPFEYITLNGKLVLYALRACTDQLRTIHDVSVLDMLHSEREGVYIVTCKVKNGKGRTDMSTGVVTIAGQKGDVLANSIMKAETKAKRRATLSICGLGFLDETELETIPTKRTQVEISAAAAKRWKDLSEIEQDILQLESEAAIERYQREVLTPEAMAALGEKQWAVEQWLEVRRREITGHVELEPTGEPVHVPQRGRGRDVTAPNAKQRWLDRILRAETADELDAMLAEIGKLPEDQKKALRQPWVEKQKQLRLPPDKIAQAEAGLPPHNPVTGEILEDVKEGDFF